MLRHRNATRLKMLVAVLAVGSLALTGCTASTKGATAKSSGLSGTLTIDWLSLTTPGIDGAVAAFKKKNPKVNVVLNLQDTTNYNSFVSTQLLSGTGPDVMSVNPGGGQSMAIEELVPNGYIEDLSKDPWVSSIPKSIKDKTQVDGKTYFAPAYVNFIGALYNMDLMKTAGLTPPTTWDGVLKYCAAAKKAGKIPYDLGSADTFAIMLPYALSATLVYAKNQSLPARMSANEATFTKDSDWAQVYTKEVQMKNAGCFGPSPNGTAIADTVTQMANGSAMGIVTIVSATGQFLDAAPKTTFKLEPFPATNNAQDTYASGGSGIGAAVNAKAQHKKLAEAFVNFFGSQAGQVAFAKANDTAPALAGASYKAPDVIKDVYALYLSGKISTLPDQNWPSALVQTSVETNVQKLMSNPPQTTPKGAVAAMDAAYATGG